MITKPRAIHFIEDDYHRFAIIFESSRGKLEVGPWGIEPVSVDDHVETMEREYPDVPVYVEEYSGETPTDHLPVDEPYPKPDPRKASD